MATIKSGEQYDHLLIGATSKAGRESQYDSTGRDVSWQSKPAFSASNTFTPTATPTDVLCIIGSPHKTVRVISIKFSTSNTTTAGSVLVNLIKRQGQNIGGTPVITSPVPLDSMDNATAQVQHYTANPTTLANAVGTFEQYRLQSSLTPPTSFAGAVQDAGVELLPWYPNSMLRELCVLRGPYQMLCVNLNGATLLTAQTQAYTVIWIEEEQNY